MGLATLIAEAPDGHQQMTTDEKISEAGKWLSRELCSVSKISCELNSSCAVIVNMAQVVARDVLVILKSGAYWTFLSDDFSLEMTEPTRFSHQKERVRWRTRARGRAQSIPAAGKDGLVGRFFALACASLIGTRPCGRAWESREGRP
nr:hypothetical protein CFP56_09171 [Quercus suber]